ncbi:MAG: helix-turn-helix domain-containing protein [Bacteriovoracaceae bacterium]|jgi:excisionase family DNA binding protein|nr:helix-turn-helix domain-containing protein [Bacteriovoracaceae bacterium]
MSNKYNYIQNKLSYNEVQGALMHPETIFNIDIKNKIEDENEAWLNTSEASNFLSITPNALRILVHRAKVRAYKIGNRLRFKKTDLLLLLQLKED